MLGVVDVLLLGGESVSVDERLVSLEHLLSVLVGSDDGRLSVEEVDLLERETLGLGDEEVGEDDASGAGGSPEEEDLDSEVGRLGSVDSGGGRVDEVRGGVSDTEVPEPVGRGRHGHGLGSDGEGEDLSGDDPGDWSPGGGESGDVDADEGDEHSLGGQVDGSSLLGGSDGDSDDGDEELAGAHDDGSPDEELPSAGSVDEEDTGDGHDDVDDVGDDGDDERVRDTGSLEEGGSVVEDEVDTG